MKIFHIVSFVALLSLIHSQCCLNLTGRICLSCPSGTHLYRGNCLIDIANCVSYQQGFDCSKCADGYQLNSTGDCNIINVPTPQYVDSLLNLSSLQPPSSQIYSMANDYFRSFKTQLKISTTLNATLRTYKNGTLEITLYFINSEGQYFKGVLQPNMSSFIFKEISFATINQPDPGFPVIIALQNISAQNAQQMSKVALVFTVTKDYNNDVNSFINGNITSYSDGSFGLLFTASGIIQGNQYLVTASINKDNKVTIKQVKQIAFAPVVPVYVEFNVKDNDQSYLITQDFIKKSIAKYQNLAPTKASKFTNNQTIYYKIDYTLNDGSTWQIQLSLNTSSSSFSIQSDTMLTPATNNGNNNNQNNNTNQNSSQQIPNSILSRVIGLTQLPSSQLSSSSFSQIDALIRSVNPQQLSSSQLLAAYSSSSSFTRTYLIYYQSQSRIYEAKVSSDSLRKRTYIISFTSI